MGDYDDAVRYANGVGGYCNPTAKRSILGWLIDKIRKLYECDKQGV